MLTLPRHRAGAYIRQVSGYRAFIPRPLPPDPPIQIDSELLNLLSRADQALGRLDAAADLLPNPDLFVGMYVRKEAVLSSQIEGTQASLMDLLEFEASKTDRRARADVREVVNYVSAMNYGLERVATLPVSNRLLREIHAKLLSNSRGGNLSPGEFRPSQNWVGPPGSTIATATFVPPPPSELPKAMGDLENYIRNEGDPTPVLLRAGLIHSQLETIHPFLDGNGRMGRLLVTFFLCQNNVLRRPLLYLSAYFKQHRETYYEKLQTVRDSGDFEGWLKFFLLAVLEVASQASGTTQKILAMREAHRRIILEGVPGSAAAASLLDHLCQEPALTVNEASRALKVSYPTANTLFHQFGDLGLVKEITGQGRNRVFVYAPYVELLNQDIFTAPLSAAPTLQGPQENPEKIENAEPPESGVGDEVSS